MRYKNLGSSDLLVSELCLGSMTWGMQNTTEDGHRQIDMSLDHGVNFIDTAEMYPTNPVKGENIGKTEEIIGHWIADRGRRDDVILATKITGVGSSFVRDGGPIDAAAIKDAVAASLKRLQTDVIDIFQLHWPNRGSYMFRQNWKFDASGQDREGTLPHMLDVLQEMQRQIDAGRVRYFGVSNESAWGVANWLRVAREHGLPEVISVQNEYSLMCRHYDLDLAELSHHENIGLMAFSPLAAGILSGKYKPDVTPKGSRREFSDNLNGRITDQTWPATQAYLDIAKRHGLDPCQMALAWCSTRPFMGSVIFGATNMDQLENALGTPEITLSDEVMSDIASAHKAHPMPY